MNRANSGGQASTLGRLYVGPYHRLDTLSDDTDDAIHFIRPCRLSEIDFVHPRDFAAVLSRFHGHTGRWTNNPFVLDCVPPSIIFVLTAKGPRRLVDHPQWGVGRQDEWTSEGGLTAGAFWTRVGERWS